MAKSYEQQNIDILKAINHRESDPGLPLTKLAEIYDILYQRLKARAKGRGDRTNSGGHNRALTNDQDATLYEIIDRLERSGMHARLSMVASIANFILRNAHEDSESEPPTVGKNWTQRFLQRHEEYGIRNSKLLAFDRSFAYDLDVIQEWYGKTYGISTRLGSQ
jgi:hypothetical protein